MGRVLSFVKLIRGADPVDRRGRQHGQRREARAVGRPCVVVDPEHAEKLHAREPGDLGTD